MNGLLSDQLLAELVREVASKNISGKLLIEKDRIQVAVYFDAGKLTYAAANVRTFRASEYLKRSGLMVESDLQGFSDIKSDVLFLKTLVKENLLGEAIVNELQTRQVLDILRLALAWTHGKWEFDGRSRLEETVDLKLEINPLLMEAVRRLPGDCIESRFRNPAEVISPITTANTEQLTPEEGYFLARLERPTPVNELIRSTGLHEPEVYRFILTLAVVGMVNRQNWKYAFRTYETPKENPVKSMPNQANRLAAKENVDDFLSRVEAATSHYEVLNIAIVAASNEIKIAYYNFARRYHPDHFQKQANTRLHSRVEAAFARLTQAYETLIEPRKREAYDAKIEGQLKQEAATAAPRASADSISASEHVQEAGSESQLSDPDRAEMNFKEGYAALQQGQVNRAIALLSAAARLVPGEARFRAYHGRALAARENTRRSAEGELLTALKMDENNAEYRAMLAELYRDLGFNLRARSQAERALSADPSNRTARELLRALKQ
ncbi:MAG: DnaJ domain-containing protein [Pyrinomonadaceae bacterium]